MSIESSSVYKKLNLLEAIYIRLLGPDFRYRIGVSGPYTDLFFWNVLHNRCEPVTCQLHVSCILHNKCEPMPAILKPKP